MVKLTCSHCGRVVEREDDSAPRVCFSFGGLDPQKELLAGRMIDPCRGTLLAEGETLPDETAGEPLNLKIESVDVSTKTYRVTRRWRPR